MRRLAALPIALLLALSGCASEPEVAEPSETTSEAAPTPAAEITPAAVDDALPVQVSGAPDAKPEVSITTPLEVEETTRKVVTAGTGEEIEAGQTVVLHFSLHNGRDGAELESTYGGTPASFPITEQLIAGVASGLLGAHVGDRIAVAVPPQDGFGPNASQAYPGLAPEDTMVLVADVQQAYVPLTQAEGEPVEPAAGLPAVELDPEGRPIAITVPEDAQAPEELVVQPLIRGAGAQVQPGQTVTVQYTGVRLEDGEQFDSSWERGQPFSTVIGQGQVIPGWDQGLVGQTVGSRVLLVIPQELAYADATPESGQPMGALVFVVDILDAR